MNSDVKSNGKFPSLYVFLGEIFKITFCRKNYVIKIFNDIRHKKTKRENLLTEINVFKNIYICLNKPAGYHKNLLESWQNCDAVTNLEHFNSTYDLWKNVTLWASNPS